MCTYSQGNTDTALLQLNVAGYEFYGQAELPQQAKHNAATQALPVVRSLPDPAATPGAITPGTPATPGTSGEQ